MDIQFDTFNTCISHGRKTAALLSLLKLRQSRLVIRTLVLPGAKHWTMTALGEMVQESNYSAPKSDVILIDSLKKVDFPLGNTMK